MSILLLLLFPLILNDINMSISFRFYYVSVYTKAAAALPWTAAAGSIATASEFFLHTFHWTYLGTWLFRWPGRRALKQRASTIWWVSCSPWKMQFCILCSNIFRSIQSSFSSAFITLFYIFSGIYLLISTSTFFI